jgi:GT2 family glycosyltransferase
MKAPFVGASVAPSTVLTVNEDWGRDDNLLGTIAIPVRDSLKTATVMSLLHSDFSFAVERGGVHRIFVQGSILTTQRNELIQRMRGNWILFIDDDMTFPPDAIQKLVQTRDEHDLDVVSGLCFRRSYPFQPTLYFREQPTSGLYQSLEYWEEGEVIEVDATGMAFCLVTKRAIERIAGPFPPLEERLAGGPPPTFFTWTGIKGEDIQFCEDLKATGSKIFVDTAVQIGHIAEVEITARNFWQAIAEREKEAEQRLRRNNRRFGIKVMTAREARKRLYG